MVDLTTAPGMGVSESTMNIIQSETEDTESISITTEGLDERTGDTYRPGTTTVLQNDITSIQNTRNTFIPTTTSAHMSNIVTTQSAEDVQPKKGNAYQHNNDDKYT